MALLYEINQESAQSEITHSLAQSLKKGVLTPATEILSLAEKLASDNNEKLNLLAKNQQLLKNLLYINLLISLVSLVSIITLLFFYN